MRPSSVGPKAAVPPGPTKIDRFPPAIAPVALAGLSGAGDPVLVFHLLGSFFSFPWPSWPSGWRSCQSSLSLVGECSSDGFFVLRRNPCRPGFFRGRPLRPPDVIRGTDAVSLGRHTRTYFLSRKCVHRGMPTGMKSAFHLRFSPLRGGPGSGCSRFWCG